MKTEESRKTFAIVLCSALLTFSVTYTGMRYHYYKNYKEYQLLSEAEKLVNDNFYFTDNIDSDILVDSAVSGYISGLDDKYSRYQSVKQTEERNDSHAGLKVGIGVTVTVREDGYIDIVSVSENSPSEKAGLKGGDIIRLLDGNDVRELGYNESVEYIKDGEENSVINITVEREGKQTEIPVKREKIEIITSEGIMLEDNIGYISITQFNDKTPEQMKECFYQFVSEGAKGIVFDVRNNSGGLVSAVEQCLDPLLPEGDVAVAVYSDGRETVIAKSDAEETDIPMVVLMNENSASGAELFAASLRDFKGTKLVGTTSYGKGIMQETFNLSNGSTVILTVAQYKTTKSECYHGVGLVPDYEVTNEGTDEDLQLMKAVEILKNENN